VFMFDEDIDPTTKKRKPKDLESLSVAELEKYIFDLNAEIDRVEKDILQKKAHQDVASSLFKS